MNIFDKGKIKKCKEESTYIYKLEIRYNISNDIISKFSVDSNDIEELKIIKEQLYQQLVDTQIYYIKLDCGLIISKDKFINLSIVISPL